SIILLFIFHFLLFTSLYGGQKLKVIVSIYPLYDFVRQVGEERVDVKLLLPPGASPHTYEPTPKVMKELSEARVFVKIGAGLEFWAEKMIKASGSKRLIVVDSSFGIQLIRDVHSHHSTLITQHSSLDSYADPHIWLDPLIARDIVTKIEKTLIEADPSNAGVYKKNASIYREKLLHLDKEISEKVKTFTIKEYVTFHSAWNYFSKRYGLKVAGVIEEAPGKEPSPKHIARIIQEVNRIGNRVIFAEPQFNPKIAEAVARESSAKVLYLDPIGGQKGRETYIEMMRYNISVMENVMK
ncbi:MAG: zinc ABC transporter substrate-binding protein, partial [Nitrospirae bacterium]|nr:zinc ABC transporter substrate-binding protein [Nitrospirota bacterium]